MEQNTTAVQWLVDQIKSDQNQASLTPQEWIQVIKQALQIERVQIIEAYANGSNDRLKNIINQDYYTETYKNEPIKNFKI